MINHDDLLGDFVRIDSIGAFAKAGKWMNYFIRLPETEWGAPVTHGILSIILLSLSVYYIVKILKIEHKVLVVTLAAILGTFPLNACYFSYMSSAEVYYFALFTAVLVCIVINSCCTDETDILFFTPLDFRLSSLPYHYV